MKKIISIIIITCILFSNIFCEEKFISKKEIRKMGLYLTVFGIGFGILGYMPAPTIEGKSEPIAPTAGNLGILTACLGLIIYFNSETIEKNLNKLVDK